MQRLGLKVQIWPGYNVDSIIRIRCNSEDYITRRPDVKWSGIIPIGKGFKGSYLYKAKTSRKVLQSLCTLSWIMSFVLLWFEQSAAPLRSRRLCWIGFKNEAHKALNLTTYPSEKRPLGSQTSCRYPQGLLYRDEAKTTQQGSGLCRWLTFEIFLAFWFRCTATWYV